MKSITELVNDLRSGKLTQLQKIETHFLLAASYLGIDNEKCIEQVKQFLELQPEDGQSSEKVKLINSVLTIAEAGKKSTEMVKLYSDLGDIYRRNQMDTALLARYVHLTRWRVKRHLQPKHYQKLTVELRERYAAVFRISEEALDTLPEQVELPVELEGFDGE